MIGRLRGTLIYKQAPDIVVDVGGVGYELLASMTTLIDLPDVDNEVIIFTHLIVREDAQTLYAFSSDTERALFRTLLKVNGVGPKMALAIVSGMTANEFGLLIHSGDITGLTRLPGVGKKTAGGTHGPGNGLAVKISRQHKNNKRYNLNPKGVFHQSGGQPYLIFEPDLTIGVAFRTPEHEHSNRASGGKPHQKQNNQPA